MSDVTLPGSLQAMLDAAEESQKQRLIIAENACKTIKTVEERLRNLNIKRFVMGDYWHSPDREIYAICWDGKDIAYGQPHEFHNGLDADSVKPLRDATAFLRAGMIDLVEPLVASVLEEDGHCYRQPPSSSTPGLDEIPF